MNTKIILKASLCAAIAIAIVGCTTMQEIKRDADQTQTSAKTEAESLLNGRASKVGQPVHGPVVTDIPFVNVTPVAATARYPLAFNRVVEFNEPSGIPVSLIASRLQALTGLAFSFQTELNISGGATAPASVEPENHIDSNGQPWAGLPNLSGGLPALPALSSGVSSSNQITLNYVGPAKGAFDAIANQIDAAWEYDESKQRVNFYKFKTETFRIAAVQGESASKAELGANESKSSQGGSESLDTAKASASHETKAADSIWAGVENTISKLMSKEGVYSVSQATGTIMVRDRPARMEMIRKYIDDTNAAMGRQVDVGVSIYRVMVNDKDVRGMNWSVMFQTLLASSGYNLNITTPRPSVIGDGLSSAIIKVPERDENGVPYRYGGSQMFIDALSTLGRTSVVQNTSVVTMNNQPAPIKVVRRTSYLAEVTPTYIGGSNSAITTGAALTPGWVETGLNVYVLPHVQDDGKRMLLKLMVSMSTLEQMAVYSSGQASIQLPQVASREFNQQAWINSGETLVLAGFEQTDAGLDTASPLDKSMWLFGGNRTAQKSREMVVVAIRPIVTAARSRI